MRRHPVADFPLPIIVFDMLRYFNSIDKISSSAATRRTQRIDLPALVWMGNGFASG